MVLNSQEAEKDDNYGYEGVEIFLPDLHFSDFPINAFFSLISLVPGTVSSQ